MIPYLEIAGDQIDGARDYQEDSFLITFVDDSEGGPNSCALLVMADGVGGAAAGNIASQMVTNTFNRQFTSRYGNEKIPDILRDSLHKANNSLRSSIAETPALEGMGCTCVVGAVSRGQLFWVSVGDSHLYLIRNGKLEKKNADHSYGAYLDMMEAAGTPVEPDPRLRRNMLISAMSGEEIVMIDCPEQPFEVKAGDRLIICSDGLDTLSEETILATAAASNNPKACVAALLQAVTDAAKPKQDNTTVIVCDLTAREEAAPAPAPEPARDAYADRYEEDELDKPKGGSKTGIIIVAVAALAVLGGVGWFLTQGGEPAPVPTEVVDTGTADETSDVTDEMTDESEADIPASAPAPVIAPVRTFSDNLRSGGTGPEMVELPAGRFMMGMRGSPEPTERPVHEVNVPGFAISAREITFAEYDRFANATGRSRPDSGSLDRSTYPVFGITWHDAMDYAAWLSRETGANYRLPTESEWEYAASAGTDSLYWWGFQLGRGRAHCFSCTPGLMPRGPVPVGSFDPNPFGLYDTVGNVSEWVQECMHPNYDGAPVDGSAWGGGDCSVRIARGGHFRSPSPTARKRETFVPDRGHAEVGLRVVREL